jgi:putative transposase
MDRSVCSRSWRVDGFRAGVGRIKRLRRELGLRCKQVKKFKATTNSNHSLPVAENLLNQDFATVRPGQVWVTDITYIPTQEGWLYLAGVKDLHTCEIVGYALGARMTQELTGQALIRAVKHKRPQPGLIHHSDRGSQYCAGSYRALLTQFKMQDSMSRKGNCYDNAPMESFWGTLKNEVGPPPALCHAGGGQGRDYRVHRNLLQPSKTAFETRQSLTRRLRSTSAGQAGGT